MHWVETIRTPSRDVVADQRTRNRVVASVARRLRGFSLIEVMIVVVIIGLLAGLVSISAHRYLQRAKRERARADLSALATAVDSYLLDTGAYPGNRDGLDVLAPDFIKAVPSDPWGRPYQYLLPGPGEMPFDIVTYGADGREGGTGGDEDLSLASLNETPTSGSSP